MFQPPFGGDVKWNEVAQSCLTLCNPMDCSLPGSWNFPGKNTGQGCHFLLQGIFPTQGSNLGLLHCRQTLNCLSHQGSLVEIVLLSSFCLLWSFTCQEQGFPGGPSGKEPVCQCRRHKGHKLYPWMGKILWRRAGRPLPVLLPGESHGQRSLVSFGPWSCKELDMTEAT